MFAPKRPVSGPPVNLLLQLSLKSTVLWFICTPSASDSEVYWYIAHLTLVEKPSWLSFGGNPTKEKHRLTLFVSNFVVFNKHQFAVCSLVKFLSIIIVVLDHFFQVFSCVLGKWLFNLLTPSCQKSEVFQAFSIIFSFMVCPD